MARNFMLCYKAENTPKDELALVSQHLDGYCCKYQRGKLPIKNIFSQFEGFFREKVEDEKQSRFSISTNNHLILKILIEKTQKINKA